MSLPSHATLYCSYQTEDGLSHNSVWTVIQDSRGFMWFGTNDGLNRFDGVRFKVYRRTNGDSLSLGNNFIHCLLEIPSGEILVGTKEGLYSYRPQTDKFRHISLDGSGYGNDRNSVHCMMLDRNGNLWVGCYGHGIYQLDNNMKVRRHFDAKNLPSRFVTAMTSDLSGHLWVGTDNAGLFQLNPANGKAEKTPLDRQNVQTIYRNSDNTLLLGTSTDGLYSYNPLSRTSKQVSRLEGGAGTVRNVKALTPLNANELVMGSDIGLLRFDCTSNRLYPYDIDKVQSIFAIALDNEGGLWLGTYFSGIKYLSPRVNAFTFLPIGTKNDIVQCIIESPGGKLLFTTNNRGASIYDPATRQISAMPDGIANENINSVAFNGDELWLGAYNQGIIVMAYPSDQILRTFTTDNGLPSNVVNVIYKSSDGTIYVGTSRGAVLYVNGKFSPIPQTHTASVKNILEDYKGNIWFATHFHGLFRKSPDGKFVNYTAHRGDLSTLPGNNINNIHLDSRGMMWVGTEGEGLALFNPSTEKVEKVFTEGDGGLPSNIVYATREDMDGDIWVTTGGGMVRISAGDHSIHNFNYLEKLLKIHYTHNSSLYLPANHHLYFGGSEGFISFNPSDITSNETAPTIHVTDFYINGKLSDRMGNGEEPIRLKATESTFGFDIACLSYEAPEQNTVAYRLDGFDKEWKTLTGRDRHIEYMNIPSGKYKLQIMGANEDGVWSEIRELPFEVARPFMLSNIMLVVYLILIGLSIYFLKRRMDSNHQRKMEKFSHAKEKELYEAKIGFFTNIAHEIRTPLSLINAPLETILGTDDVNERTRRNLMVMKSNVTRLLELANQLLDFRKVESQLMRLRLKYCNASQMLESICHRYEEYASVHNITLDCSGVESGLECALDAEAFKKIVANLMSNAMKVAKHRIVVKLHHNTADETLRLEIADDGIGIKEKDFKKIFESFYQCGLNGKHPGTGLGLPLAQSLAKMHSGEITVESEYGKGSRFFLRIPMNLAPDPVDETENPENVKEEKDGKAVGGSEKGENTFATSVVTLLVVDDNDELRRFITDNLSDSFNILAASNGLEALDIIEKNNVDIIVSDIMMPDMDGIEFLRALRGNNTYAHLPVILLSAKTDVKTKIEGLNIGADAYLDKPFSVEQLRAQINSILESIRRMREIFVKSPLDFYKKPIVSDNTQEAENAKFVKKLNELILENLTNPEFNIDGLARMFLMSRSNFHKRVKGITGKPPNDYIRIIRLSKSAELLATGQYQIVEVCFMVGFNTPSYFSKCFFEHFGKLPKDFINHTNTNTEKK